MAKNKKPAGNRVDQSGGSRPEDAVADPGETRAGFRIIDALGQYFDLCEKKDSLSGYAGEQHGGSRREMWLEMQADTVQMLKNIREQVNE